MFGIILAIWNTINYAFPIVFVHSVGSNILNVISQFFKNSPQLQHVLRHGMEVVHGVSDVAWSFSNVQSVIQNCGMTKGLDISKTKKNVVML